MASYKFIDVGANLLDDMYRGEYNGKKYHEPDLQAVLQRAWDAGMDKMIITAGNLEESKAALALARTDERLFCTVGCHPTRCGEFDAHPEGPDAYLAELRAVMDEGKSEGKVVAVGECGLDYDRLHFCDAETQKKHFASQFALASSSGLPMFLHLRAAAADFVPIMREHDTDYIGGCVHSFDGSSEELKDVLSIDKLSIGINGCSLKTEENLAVMAQIPLARLMIETDCPWCEIRPSHASKPHVAADSVRQAKDRKKYDAELLVKGRNEPCNIKQVLDVIVGYRSLEDAEATASQLYDNAATMFFPSK